MKRIRLVVIAALVGFCDFNLWSAFPLEKGLAAKDIQVSVDARVELVSLIFRLAGNPEYCQNTTPDYIAAIERHFRKYEHHAAVEYARLLRANQHISFNAPMGLAVIMSDAVSLNESVPLDPLPEGLDSRWTPESARKFLAEAREFVRDTGFNDFFAAHRPFYDLAVSQMQKVLAASDPGDWFADFFGPQADTRLSIVLSLQNGGANYGAQVKRAGGRTDMFAILGVRTTEEEKTPRFAQNILAYIAHEFIHSYTNPLVDKYEASLRESGEKIFSVVAQQMSKQAYGHWKFMMYETLVRVCVCRYLLQAQGEEGARAQLDNDVRRGFLWLKELFELLGTYESERMKYPNLDAFFPRIISFFDNYNVTAMERDHKVQLARQRKEWEERAPKVVSLDPPNGALDVDPALRRITITFDRPMYKGNYGSKEGPRVPKMSEKPSWDASGKMLTIPVELEPDKEYEYWLNMEDFLVYMSQEGVHLVPLKVTFKTRIK